MSSLVYFVVQINNGLLVILQVLHAFATEGAHCSKVRDLLDSSEVSYESLSPLSSSTYDLRRRPRFSDLTCL